LFYNNFLFLDHVKLRLYVIFAVPMLLLRDLLEPIVEAFPLLGVLASPAPLTFLLV
jgi:hypothetical protein